MIRFGIVLSVVLIAIGLLATGVVAGSLLLVTISIGVAVLATLMLAGGVIVWRHEIFGVTEGRAAAGVGAELAMAGVAVGAGGRCRGGYPAPSRKAMAKTPQW